MKGKFFLSLIIGGLFFNTQLLLASGDPSISLSPTNGTTYEGGINGYGRTVTISYDVSNLESCWWHGEWTGFEVWLYVDSAEVAYYRDP